MESEHPAHANCHCSLLTGDGRLGLLIAQVLALRAPGRVTHFGRHAEKMALVSGTQQVVVTDATASEHAGQFGLVVEASGAATGDVCLTECVVEALLCAALGAPDVVACWCLAGSASGIRTALALTRAMGTLVLKTTVSLEDPGQPGWSELANDIVVYEKVRAGGQRSLPCLKLLKSPD